MPVGIRPFKNGVSYSPKTAMYKHNCHWCGTEFTGSMDKNYCSASCRVNAWRKRKEEATPQKIAQPVCLAAWGSVRFFVLHRDGFKCRYCGRGAKDNIVLHVDHYHPKIAGGTNHPDNLVTACAECNLGKGAKIIQIRPD